MPKIGRCRLLTVVFFFSLRSLEQVFRALWQWPSRGEGEPMAVWPNREESETKSVL